MSGLLILFHAIETSIYKRIIEFFPTNISAYNNLANLYLTNERFLEAGIIYKQILKINPKSRI